MIENAQTRYEGQKCSYRTGQGIRCINPVWPPEHHPKQRPQRESSIVYFLLPPRCTEPHPLYADPGMKWKMQATGTLRAASEKQNLKTLFRKYPRAVL